MSESVSNNQTLGVDLASSPKKTGLCVVEWCRDGARVDRLEVGSLDGDIVNLTEKCSATGIDAPFGWPRKFREFLGRPSLSALPFWGKDYRAGLRYRVTDST